MKHMALPGSLLFILFCMFVSGPLLAKKKASPRKMSTAIFAGGCFWCTESDFEEIVGVKSAVSGYIDGKVAKPTYKQVSSGSTGHTEAVKIVFDPAVVSFKELLQVYWLSVDPTVKDRQFCDTGSQYRTGIYYLDDSQKKEAEKSKSAVKDLLKKTIYTEVKKATTFYPAEEYHQDYYKKNPVRYKYYRFQCGRDSRLKEIWEGIKDDKKKSDQLLGL